jgi:hypothetical protein
MRGQWKGHFKGKKNNGVAILELDELGQGTEGSLYAYPDDATLPGLSARVMFARGERPKQLQLELFPVYHGRVASWADFERDFPGLEKGSSQLLTDWQFNSSEIKINWNQDGSAGAATLVGSKSGQPSDYQALPNISSWQQFKDFAIAQEPYRFIYRGHESNRWRLRTHFHRCGRFDLQRFTNQDIPLIHGHLCSLTSHFFDLVNPLHNAAFYSLIQHHGYPTPLLDWTLSPFIAAFFAYRKVSREISRTTTDKVRILVLDSREWIRDFPPAPALTPWRPNFSLLHPLSINNPRLVPQQAMSTVSNIDDIEDYITGAQAKSGKRYLQVIDLPVSDRAVIMQELALMGITAGSLFPGLDGACEQLRERLFDR